MRSAAKAIWCGCAVALTLLLAGCHGQPASADGGGRRLPSGSSRPVPVAATLDGRAAALVTRTGTYYSDEHALDAAESRLTHVCMATRGFDHPASAVSGPPSKDEEWRPDLAERQRIGYGLGVAGSDQSPESTDLYVQSLSQAEQEGYARALFGEPSDRSLIDLRNGKRLSFPTRGCLAGSRAQIYGDVVQAARAFFVPQDYVLALDGQVRQDADYRNVSLRWGVCMNRLGHSYPSPAEARKALAQEYRTADHTTWRRHEIEVAVADARCAREVHLPAVVESLLLRYARRLPAAEVEELNSIAALRAVAAERARLLTETTAAALPVS
jgi:hypothetical protein